MKGERTRRPGVFRLPNIKMRKTNMNSRATTLVSTMASPERVLEATPSLQRHYELIDRLDAFLKGATA